MPKVSVRFSKPRSRGYDILIQPGLAQRAGAELSRRFPKHAVILLSSPRVHRLWGKTLEASLKKAGLPLLGRHLVPDGERFKTFAEYEKALRALARLGRGQA